MTDKFTPEQAIEWWEEAAEKDPIRLITGGHCQNFEQFLGNGFLETQAVLKEVAKHIKNKPLMRVRLVDYGCGLGRLTLWLAQELGRVVGVDASATMVDKATTFSPVYASTPDYKLCDGRSFPLKARSVDVVFSKSVFQHLPRDVVREVIADAHRVLRPGGILIFQLPACEDDADAAYAETPQRVSRWSRHEIEEALAEFTIEQLPIGKHWGWHVGRK